MLEVYIDGACEPINPGGTASYGIIALRKPEGVFSLNEPMQELFDSVLEDREPKYNYHIPLGYKKIWEKSAVVGSGDKMSNNVAEYAGLIAFLEWFDDQPVEDVIIKSDSQLLVNQMSGKWRIKQGLYVPYAQRTLTIMLHNAVAWKGKIKFQWVPREENWEADKLSKDILLSHGVRTGD